MYVDEWKTLTHIEEKFLFSYNISLKVTTKKKNILNEKKNIEIVRVMMDMFQNCCHFDEYIIFD